MHCQFFKKAVSVYAIKYNDCQHFRLYMVYCIARKFGMELKICMLVFGEEDVVSECMVDQQGL